MDPFLSPLDLLAARQAYAEGRNVTEVLRAQAGVQGNTPQIIEAAYDLQAGTYVRHVEAHFEQAGAYASELAALLAEHVDESSSLLDVGTGELTTLSLLVPRLPRTPGCVLAFDISWSRLHTGLAFARRHMGDAFGRLLPFVADMTAIPLRDQSVDVITSSHALEPNGQNLPALLRELFRVARRKLVLFEPSWELNSEEGRQRMDRLGYIRGVEQAVGALGGRVLAVTPIRNVNNPLNPTACYVIEPPARSPARARDPQVIDFAVPGTDCPLARIDDFFWSADTGLCFPVLKGLPVLKPQVAILASALG